MVQYSIEYNKEIFGIYSGLTAAGYDLAKKPELEELHRRIGEIPWDKRVTDFLREARTSTCAVNPYWPRAFLLTLACLYLAPNTSGEYAWTDFYDLDRYIQNLPLNPEEKDSDTISWLRKVPVVCTLIQNQKKLNELWQMYLELLRSNECFFKATVRQAISDVAQVFGALGEFPHLVFIPNYLQAPQATDVVQVGNRIYVVESEPHRGSIIHEISHYLLEKSLVENREVINEFLHLLEPVAEEMIRYQYAWDNSESSWQRVWEENFMRALSIWIEHREGKLTIIQQKAESQASQGFLYVPIIIDKLRTRWEGLSDFSDFLLDCLIACQNR